MTTAIDTQVWAKDPDRPGYLRLERTKTVREVYEELREVVGAYPLGGDEYFSVMPSTPTEWPCPPGGRIVVFAATGSSEGDYVHVEVLHGDRRTLLLIAKTFAGRDAAWTFARRLADLLGT